MSTLTSPSTTVVWILSWSIDDQRVDAGAFDPSDSFGVIGEVLGETDGGLLDRLGHMVLRSRYRDIATMKITPPKGRHVEIRLERSATRPLAGEVTPATPDASQLDVAFDGARCHHSAASHHVAPRWL